MDAGQRSTGEANFDIDEVAYDKVYGLKSIGYYLSLTIHDKAHKFIKKKGIIQNYGVMVEYDDGEPMTFEIWILNQDEGENPILVDLNPIPIDRYLDMINQNKSITHESKKENNE